MDQAQEHITAVSGETFSSEWIKIDQAMIDTFADTTRDWMFLHVDPEKAEQTEYGGTIAHGFLTLSLLAPMRAESGIPPFPGLRNGLNYGLDRVRFLKPVRSGKRIRGHFTIASLEENGPGRYREVADVRVEIEGEEKPALIAAWLTLYIVADQPSDSD